MKFIHVIALLLFLSVGCRTGGSRINTGSSGILSITSGSNLVKQPSGVYKVEPIKQVIKVEPVKPVIKPSEPVKPVVKPSEPAIVKKPPPTPTPTPAPHAEKIPPVKQESPTPEQSEEKLPPLASNPNSLPPVSLNSPEIKLHEKHSNGGGSIVVKWSALISFYAVCVSLILISWLSYALYKDWRRVQSLRNNSEPNPKPQQSTDTNNENSSSKT